MSADRNLLFGILALQMDFISRDALVQAMNGWVLDKAKPLGQVLVEQGALPSARRVLLDGLVEEHLALHGHDPEQSLAALGNADAIHEALSRIADSDLQASLAHIGSTPSATGDYVSAGTPTSAGLRFRILRPHAKGGLGQVFVARDEQLRRDVALKEIQPEHADHPASRARFLLEAEITGGLEHPGIVPVH